MPLSCCNALFNYLTPMFVSRYLCEVLHDWFINYASLFIGFEQYYTLTQAVISPNIATHVKDAPAFQRLEN